MCDKELKRNLGAERANFERVRKRLSNSINQLNGALDICREIRNSYYEREFQSQKNQAIYEYAFDESVEIETVIAILSFIESKQKEVLA
jgi:hypothetical protein